MPDQLLPPPPPPTAEDSVRAWIDLLEICEQLVWAGFESQYGPERGREEYREWADRQVVEHHERFQKLVARLARAG